MNFFKNILISFLFASTTVMAIPASDESIKELLTITEEKKLFDVEIQKVQKVFQGFNQAVKESSSTPSEQEAFANLQNEANGLIQLLSWEKMEPILIRSYKELFTEEEIIDIISFYKTPSGQALIKKSPALLGKKM